MKEISLGSLMLSLPQDPSCCGDAVDKSLGVILVLLGVGLHLLPISVALMGL